MNVLKLSVLAFALASPLTSYAFSTTDLRGSDERSKAHQIKVEEYAAKVQKPVPVIQNYAYGMKLDVAKVVIKTPAPGDCGINYKFMTYEDSQGDLNTLSYKAITECAGRN
ncbi:MULTISPECIES: DUF2790 domain-containing protein [Gammaproteobacteria]|uniref:DUF2790 domain-containing protein n=1 Tax=Pseudomonas cichorii TaxID=36746 RepID=A0A3M4W6D7_PSECI|nr:MULTISPECIES: DUF2790 domain-containing protein [Pseudomonas]AHF67536.1 hypothetical protein PCH70_23830 [Pseudomonas cichorii JBC1]MBI6853017.1 DUF2790 domain-containing protein [Pseudomonas cichorii]MBX8487874.1 DUF2790 domain-containing protein [Pseudomonas cichorii]MBX8497955.1 DUF2790 domain-containing protein [Pseudomonas cichorii]MBX8514040.1 DUF2790 domain-containing protein [Pseudomonas cichorii]